MPQTIIALLMASLTLSPLGVLADEAGVFLNCNATGATAAASRYYPITDSQGSVRFLTDSTGAIVNSYTYTPYGAGATSNATATTTPYLYTGENLDSETSLTYLRARYYDPSTSRFISRDPVRGVLTNPLTQNPYIYAGDNPMMYSDPSGEFVQFLILAGLLILFDSMVESPDAVINPCPEDIARAQNIGFFFGLVGALTPGGGAKKAIITSGEVISGLRVTTHAAKRFAERNISLDQIANALAQGAKYLDAKTGNILHVVETGSGKGYGIFTNVAQNVLLTVEDFIPKLNPERYIPL